MSREYWLMLSNWTIALCCHYRGCFFCKSKLSFASNRFSPEHHVSLTSESSIHLLFSLTRVLKIFTDTFQTKKATQQVLVKSTLKSIKNHQSVMHTETVLRQQVKLYLLKKQKYKQNVWINPKKKENIKTLTMIYFIFFFIHWIDMRSGPILQKCLQQKPSKVYC